MKEFDTYAIVTGFILLSGFVASSGVGDAIALIRGYDYVLCGIAVCAVTLGFVVYKIHQNKSTNS